MEQSLRFKQYRERAHLNQKEAAEELGVPSYVLSNYELGRSEPKIEVLVKMCYLYKCDANELLGVNRLCAHNGITPMDPEKQLEENNKTIALILERLNDLEDKYNK